MTCHASKTKADMMKEIRQERREFYSFSKAANRRPARQVGRKVSEGHWNLRSPAWWMRLWINVWPSAWVRVTNRYNEKAMSKFNISRSRLPQIVNWFSDGKLRAGEDCLAITYSGEGKWSTSFWTEDPVSKSRPLIGKHKIGGIEITFAESTSKGSTVEVDGSVTEWVRPAICYYSPDAIDSVGDSKGNGVVYMLKDKNPPPVSVADEKRQTAKELAIHNAKSMLDAALFNLEQQKHVNANITANGLTLTEIEIARLVQYQHKYDEAKARLDGLTGKQDEPVEIVEAKADGTAL